MVIFAGQEKPIYHLQKQGNIHMFQNKFKNPHKCDEIMKKNSVFGKFYSLWHSNSVSTFLNFSFIMSGAFERKENDFSEFKNIIYTQDTAFQNGQVHHWRLKIKIYMIDF